MKSLRPAFFAFVLAYPLTVTAGLFGPDNYEECILDSMKGVTSDVAARAIAGACAKKFPAEKPAANMRDEVVSSSVLANVTGRASVSRSGTFLSGNIYNANVEWTITQLTLTVGPDLKDGKFTDVPKQYFLDATVPPLSNHTFTMSIDFINPKDTVWSIIGAKARKAR